MNKIITLIFTLLSINSVLLAQEAEETIVAHKEDNVLHKGYAPDCHINEYDSMVHLNVKLFNLESPQRITAFASDGYAFIQGGICLGHIEKLQERNSRSIQCDACNTWQDGVIPYEIDPQANYSSYTLNEIQKAIERINNETNVCIIPRTTETDYVRIINGNGCWSYVGRNGGMQEISIQSPGCNFEGTIIHEFLHALGMFHEQCREDRDNHVGIQYQNIDPTKTSNFDQLNAYGEDHDSYDYGSIMHYGAYAFSMNGYPTILKVDGTPYGLGQRDTLSHGDINSINDLYTTPASHVDYETLMILYNATEGSNWTMTDDWADESSCSPCNWEGVDCADGRVSSILLQNKGLTGVLPSLSDLVELEALDLSGNDLTGSLPAFSQVVFPDLSMINLSGNGFTFDALEGNFSGIADVVLDDLDPFTLTMIGNVISASEAGGTELNNTYTWFKNNEELVTITGDASLDISAYAQRTTSSSRNFDDVYRVEVENATLPGVTLNSEDFVSNAPFPVDLVSFSGQWDEKYNAVDLAWQVASEIENSGWVIERSRDGKVFEYLSWKEGAGTSETSKTYSYQDNNPYAGMNYYRLRQMDYNGSETLSTVVQVRNTNTEISVRPTIVSDNLLYISNAKLLEYGVLDFSGRNVREGVIGSDNAIIDLSDIASGSYFIKVGDQSSRITKK